MAAKTNAEAKTLANPSLAGVILHGIPQSPLAARIQLYKMVKNRYCGRGVAWVSEAYP